MRPAQSWAILSEAVVGAARGPGGVDFLDQIGEGLGLPLRAAQFFFGPHDEDLIEGFDSQAFQLFTFWLSSHLAVLLFEWAFHPHILQVPAIWHNYSQQQPRKEAFLSVVRKRCFDDKTAIQEETSRAKDRFR